MSWLNAVAQYAKAHPEARAVYLTQSIRDELHLEYGVTRIGDVREPVVAYYSMRIVTITDLMYYYRVRFAAQPSIPPLA